MKMSRTVMALTIAAATLFAVPSAFAQAFTVHDVAGRDVSFDKPVDKVVLGEGRLIYSIATIETDDPFAKVVGWRKDLMTTDFDGFKAYEAKFPEVKDIPFLGKLTDGTLQTESIVKLDPDVVILTIGDKQAAEEVGLEKMLDGIGVKVVYVDFREHILDNTVPSLHILGQLFGKEARADEVADYWQGQMDRVADVLKANNPTRPNVFMYRAAGLTDCCGTFGKDNFGLMVELAGGHNLGSDFLPGYTGTINPEQVIASNPDVIIATGSNWSQYKKDANYVNVGPNAAPTVEQSRATLKSLVEGPAFVGSKAVANGDVHAIWHQFYTSPYQFVAIQRIAKWLHPDLFADLDPDATFQEFHDKFLPIDYQPGYWLSVKDED